MAQRRSTRSAGDEDEPATRPRRARRPARPPANRNEPEAVEAEDTDVADDREPEPADADEPEAVDDREPEDADEPDDEPDRDDETTDADGQEQDDREQDDRDPDSREQDDREQDSREQDDRDQDDREQDRSHSRRGNGSALTAKQAAQAALGQIMELTSKSAEGITEVGRTEDGWVVGIEVVEDRRIPSAADILASYQVTLDADGELTSYRRIRRYMRGRGDLGDGS